MSSLTTAKTVICYAALVALALTCKAVELIAGRISTCAADWVDGHLLAPVVTRLDVLHDFLFSVEE